MRDADAVVALLTTADAFISGAPYFFKPAPGPRRRAPPGDQHGRLRRQHRPDRAQLALDEAARSAGITLTPDCGQVPGLGHPLCAHDEPVR